MALLSGLGLDWITTAKAGSQTSWKYTWGGPLLLMVLVTEALANQIHDHFIKPSERYKAALETEIQCVIPFDAKVVFVSSASPQELFLLHRKGWCVYPEQLKSKKQCDDFRSHGAEFVVLNVPVTKAIQDLDFFKQAMGKATVCYQSSHYQVYKLK